MCSICAPPRVDWMRTPWPTSQDVSGDDRQGSYAEARALLVIPSNDTAENGEPRQLSVPPGIPWNWQPIRGAITTGDSHEVGRSGGAVGVPHRMRGTPGDGRLWPFALSRSPTREEDGTAPVERAGRPDEDDPLLRPLAV